MPYYSTTSTPPLEETYVKLPSNALLHQQNSSQDNTCTKECEIPTINLHGLTSNISQEITKCKEDIAKAASEWGIFHVLDHGISHKLLHVMRTEQIRLFSMPFEKKRSWCGLPYGSYRWGTPTATCQEQFSWSEAFHVPLSDIDDSSEEFKTFREVMDKLATDMSNLANTIARSLSEYLGDPSTRCVTKSCSKSTSFFRLNHYPDCPFSEEIFGLVPHTDSSYLTIVHPDKVGKLQVKMNDSKWVSVQPKPGALIVNIGDLFQAWSNDVYKSVEHRVMPHSGADRHSIVYFLCPSYDSPIGSCTGHSPIYRSFTFGEFRKEVDKDVKQLGCKVGLPRFHL
ncbi:hypothetical protein LUZ61_020567 [Rhynchospora tenuis]|uniref:Fe2OG dioxygenase domain-containing protein n=1 Tax=Rhynchospora tenuis TaxID=198213 RepID=A0AAD5ZDC2_9POAL|nr:hypothetical protein LUZ61_020567 [Rhynchospora tenuis]